ncbi:hypothetical protein DXG01_015528 [Tephrocybe rancida]|nr:hypothetical protein DXG01_015528 [Tephrocybe rancida]
MLTQCVVHEMADTPHQILSTNVIRLLQAATDKDDPTVRVNSYKYDWWDFEKKQNVVLFSMEALTECLNHHRTVTGKAPPKYPTTGKYSPNAVMDIQNELSIHATSALSRTHITSRRAAGLFLLWHGSMSNARETEDPPHDMDASWMSILQCTARLSPLVPNQIERSRYASSLPGPTGNGEYLSLPNSASSSPTPALPFEELSADIINIPLLTPSAYPTHFRLPPLGHGAWVAPKQSMVDPKIATTLLHVPPPASVTVTVADVAGNDHRPPQPAASSGAKDEEGPGQGPAPSFGNDADPSYGMELSDDKDPGIEEMEVLLGQPGNGTNPAYDMELSDNKWDPLAGLVLSDDDEVVRYIEISDDDGA